MDGRREPLRRPLQPSINQSLEVEEESKRSRLRPTIGWLDLILLLLPRRPSAPASKGGSGKGSERGRRKRRRVRARSSSLSLVFLFLTSIPLQERPRPQGVIGRSTANVFPPTLLSSPKGEQTDTYTHCLQHASQRQAWHPNAYTLRTD